MNFLYDVKVLAVKHFEKLIACAAAGLFAASMIQSIGTMSFNETSETDDSLYSMTFTKFMADANSRNITYEEVIFPSKEKAKNTGKNNKESVGINSTQAEKAVSSGTVNTYYGETKNKSESSSTAENKKETTFITCDSKKETKKSNYKKTGNKVKDRLNAAELKPKEFLKGKDEKILKKHLNKIIDDDMTNYQKAKACYDYIINNTYYSYGGWGNAIESVLENGYGTCTEYSYVYMAMMKYLGFNAKTVDGSTAMAAGGYGYHMWVEVKLNGKTYVFDPQVEDDMTNGKINYYRFCKTYSEVSGSYIK